MTTRTSVIASRSGNVFQIGRPSGISYMMFAARMNAATYPDADHSATAMPMTVPVPAAP
ncbi:hypothetical protein HNR40_010839 [Nonomuraea endophytica]|uniref:Uncharacterized protein n=1 Tax=Nonomuraea endophytica TaxID=714136 RepID=A0A7W8AGN9_9ACTN|nr:hypothetical protein [Nonomuraea endophytica]